MIYSITLATIIDSPKGATSVVTRDITALQLNEIAGKCAQESKRFFRRQDFDPSYCFEMFRRAFADRDRQAWETLYTQYRPLVSSWVVRHSAFSSSGEESQYFVNCAFEKMWLSVTPEKFNKFADLKSLFRYLQLCVHSEIIDYVRGLERASIGLEPDMPARPNPTQDYLSIEEVALEKLRRVKIREWFETRFKNEKEQKVIYGFFVLALKPREIYAQYSELFQNIEEIYRVKENVLNRMRRDPELKSLIGQDD